MKIKNNLLTYGLVGVGGLVVGAIASAYFIGWPLLKVSVGEVIQLCPSCGQDAHSDKCRACAEGVMSKVQKQFGFRFV